MKARNQISVAKSNAFRLPLKAALCGLCAWNRAAHAQPEIATPPVVTELQPASQLAETNEFQVFAPPAVEAPAAYQPFKWGEIDARPHLTYQIMYASGLQSAPGQQEDTLIQEISPGVTFDLGPHWTLDYTPTIGFYSNRHFGTEFDNSVLLTGHTAYEDWVFGLSQSVVTSDSPIVETAMQTEQQTYSTALTASRDFNNELSLDLGLYQDFQDADQLQDSRDWSTMEWLNYKFTPRLNVGVGAGLGYVNVDSGPDQSYEQWSARCNWRATDKISFAVSAGLEDRQFLDSGTGSLISPTYSATVQYQPFQVTKISVSANRTVTPSYFFDQVTDTTSVNAGVNQQLLEKLYLDLGVGYDQTKYLASSETVDVNREDNYYTFSARLTRTVFKRGTVSAFYQYGDNSSTAVGYTYSSSQVGVTFSYSF